MPFLVRAAYMCTKAATLAADKAASTNDLASFSKPYADVDASVKELLACRDAHGDEAHRLGVRD